MRCSGIEPLLGSIGHAERIVRLGFVFFDHPSVKEMAKCRLYMFCYDIWPLLGLQVLPCAVLVSDLTLLTMHGEVKWINGNYTRIAKVSARC